MVDAVTEFNWTHKVTLEQGDLTLNVREPS